MLPRDDQVQGQTEDGDGKQHWTPLTIGGLEMVSDRWRSRELK
jgi:hypothetical protein